MVFFQFLHTYLFTVPICGLRVPVTAHVLVVVQLDGDDATLSALDVVELEHVRRDLHVRHRDVRLGFYDNLRAVHDLK